MLNLMRAVLGLSLLAPLGGFTQDTGDKQRKIVKTRETEGKALEPNKGGKSGGGKSGGGPSAKRQKVTTKRTSAPPAKSTSPPPK